MKTNFYEKSIKMLIDGVAEKLTDEELIDLLRSIYSDEHYKEMVLVEIISSAQDTINQTESILYDNVVSELNLRSKEIVYLIYEALELTRAERIEKK